MQDENEPEDEAQLKRRTQTLRKRYDRIKDKLRRCAEQSGMLDR
jgi:hypothetical protein